MFSNLLWLFLLLTFIYDKYFKQEIILSIIIGISLMSIIWLKEYFFPSFNYWNLDNRLISTLGHPNYVSAVLLMIIPLLYNKVFKSSIYGYIPVLLLISITLLLTKSMIALWLFWLYNIYFIYHKFNISKWKWLFIISILIWWFSYVLINFWIITKLSSLISRLFIWQTTSIIILSDIKTLFIWNWLDTLNLIFNNFKVKELYIFENIWFSADRPHNIILNFFYHFWLLWLSFIIYIYYKLYNSLYLPLTVDKSSILLWLTLISIFLLFNFASIYLYLLIIIFIFLEFFKWEDYYDNYMYKIKKISLYSYIILWAITIISIYGVFNSFNYYSAEINIKKWNVLNAISIYDKNANYYLKNKELDKWLSLLNMKTENYYYYKIYIENNKLESCNQLITNYNSVENNFYCWDIFKKTNWDITKQFYKQWISLLPNLWVRDNWFQNGLFLKYFFTTHRFYAEKFWIIDKLEYLDIKIESKVK